MNDKVRMIIMEELDISPSEFKKRFESEEVSPEDNRIKNIALRCEGIKGNSLNYPDGVRRLEKAPQLPNDQYCPPYTVTCTQSLKE